MKEPSYLTHSPAAKQWEDIGIKHHHGIAVPLFSIHSSQSYGIGEYPDLLLLIDLCCSIGFDVIQLLPINDCGLGTSPYSALSAFALNPLFLGLSNLPHFEEYPLLTEQLKSLPKFSQAQRIDYIQVRENKNRFLRAYYQLAGAQILESKGYQEFTKSAPWLRGYGAFEILKNRYAWTGWETWPEHEQKPTDKLIDSIIEQEKDEFHWHCLLQYLCDLQMREVKNYASGKNCFIMGDIPILIDRESADVWQHQDLFNLRYAAGAPPDVYSETGQNWGFPIYHWHEMENQNYRWWRERLQWATRHYHIYRIDHIVGFFRIWSIPYEQKSNEGRFIPEDERTWINHGQRILLMMLESSNMLPIGEDLGVVPPEVRDCLSALGICGTRVVRWERDWRGDGQFILPQNYPFDSLTTVSIHDSETLQQWWKKYPIEAQLYCNFKGWSYQPILSREYQREILWDSHHSNSFFHINLLQEYLPLIPGLSWPDPDDERINIPGLVSDRNWTYRLRLSLEDLAEQTSLLHQMKELIK